MISKHVYAYLHVLHCQVLSTLVIGFSKAVFVAIFHMTLSSALIDHDIVKEAYT
jgi:hypothetical protein